MNLHEFIPALPEIFILIMICVIMMLDLFLDDEHRGFTYALTQLTLIVAAVITWRLYGMHAIVFSGQFVFDKLAAVLKFFIYLMGFALLMYGRTYVPDHKMPRGEFHVLVLLSLLGAMVLVSANSLLTLYIGLELMSLPLYAMVAMQRHVKRSSEAAMKYFVMGAMASGLLLFSFSFIYGLSGTILLPQIMTAHILGAHTYILMFALVFAIVAIAFKFAAVPFHMWAPDVYEGAPVVVTAFLGTIPKLAAFALLMRLVVGGFHLRFAEWHVVLTVLGILSIFFGNILALVQTNLKRLFAYSTISHIGFIFLAVALGTSAAYDAALYYAVVYVIMAVGGFGMILVISHKTEAENISDFTGLNFRNSWLAAMMLLLMLSMAGIPPLVGFDAKLYVIMALVNQHHYIIATYGLLMSVVGAYYYLRVVKVMYFDKPTTNKTLTTTVDGFIAASVNGLLVLLLGIFPAMLVVLCQGVF